MNSILTSVKCLLGIEESFEAFDDELIMYINMAIRALTQIGVGPQEGFNIAGESETWEDFLGEDTNTLANARTYVALKVRLLFDPPTNGSAVEAINSNLQETEWRIYETIDSKREVT